MGLTQRGAMMHEVARERWGQEQVAALIEDGENPRDAEHIVRVALSMMPLGVDPAAWLPSPSGAVEAATLSALDRYDARADWYASDAVPGRWKRILDAHVQPPRPM